MLCKWAMKHEMATVEDIEDMFKNNNKSKKTLPRAQYGVLGEKNSVVYNLIIQY